jgi:hypothetical protein
MVVNYIYGGQNILASGSGFIQSVTTGVTAGDLDSLVRAMQELGLPPKSADELQSAVKSDPARAELNRLGDHVRKWYSRTVDLVLDGTVQLAASAGAGIILQLLGRYYGWP